MKKISGLFIILVLIAFTFSNTLIAQPMPPGNSFNGNPPIYNYPPLGLGPLGSSVSDSILPLVIIALVYAGIKIYQLRQLGRSA